MNVSRRKLLLSTMFGTGAVGLRALATGLPVSFFSGIKEAKAADPPPACTKPQYVFFLTSGSGDPLNANVGFRYYAPPAPGEKEKPRDAQ